jgi:hypothetical protein
VLLLLPRRKRRPSDELEHLPLNELLRDSGLPIAPSLSTSPETRTLLTAAFSSYEDPTNT